MEFVEGFRITDRTAMLDASIEIDQLMNRLMPVFNKMILALGFFMPTHTPATFL